MFRPKPRVSKENLALGKSFSIDVLVQDDYTHFVQISLLPGGRVLQTIPFDPTDRTVAGVLLPATVSALGEEAEAALSALSKALLTHLGAKEVLVLPAGQSLPGYSSPEESGFSRLRYRDRVSLMEASSEVLKEYKDLTAEFDKQFHFILSEPELMAGQNPLKRYQAIHGILEQARFTTDKMAEYKGEELQGKMSRFKSHFVRPLVMVDQKGQIAGMVRALLMGPQFAYLSDEVVNQDLIPLDRFQGSSLEEQRSNREVFLLSYLMNRACLAGLQDQRHLFIIAASGREKIYERAGYEGYPLSVEGYTVAMKFGPPGAVLTRAQERIKALPLLSEQPAAKAAASSKSWEYGKYLVAGLALVGVGLFALSRLSKSSSPAPSQLPQPKI